MYKVISIEEYTATRDIKLQNMQTGTIETCFDDSALVSDNNFEFMIPGEEYDCKIKLFGSVTSEKQDESLLCKNEGSCIIGSKRMVKVLIGNDEYYIHESSIGSNSELPYFYFDYSRKDLIAVDDVIHADLL